jgi:hypothetical protein
MYVNVIKNYVEAIIKCRYRLTYMLILLLINLVVFLKWDHVDSNKSLIKTLDKRSIVKQGTLDYFCLPGHLRCFVNRRVKQQSIMEKKKEKKK